jgi:hypothetical protein
MDGQNGRNRRTNPRQRGAAPLNFLLF